MNKLTDEILTEALDRLASTVETVIVEYNTNDPERSQSKTTAGLMRREGRRDTALKVLMVVLSLPSREAAIEYIGVYNSKATLTERV